MEEPQLNPTSGPPDYREALSSNQDYSFNQLNTSVSTKENPVLKRLRDPIWQFVGVIVAMATIYYGWFMEDTRSLTATVITSAKLGFTEGMENKFDILYNGKSVENPILFQVRIENTGTQAIKEDEFSRPIKINFAPSTEILEASIVDSRPENIGATITTDSKVITLPNTLLNPDDAFTVRIILDDTDNSEDVGFKLDARIVDIKDIIITDVLSRKEGESLNVYEVIVLIIAGVVGNIIVVYFSSFVEKALLSLKSKLFNK